MADIEASEVDKKFAPLNMKFSVLVIRPFL
jgi:hypothetical protein